MNDNLSNTRTNRRLMAFWYGYSAFVLILAVASNLIAEMYPDGSFVKVYELVDEILFGLAGFVLGWNLKTIIAKNWFWGKTTTINRRRELRNGVIFSIIVIAPILTISWIASFFGAGNWDINLVVAGSGMLIVSTLMVHIAAIVNTLKGNE